MEGKEGTGSLTPTSYKVYSENHRSQALATQELSKWSEATDGNIVMKNVGTLDITGSDRIEKNPRTGAMHLWKTKLRQHRGQLCQVLILTPVILVMVGLFLIPTVFYAQEENLAELQSTTEVDCLEVVTYSGDVCRETLTSLQTCFSDETSPPAAVNIPSLIDQQRGERDAMSLVNGLSILNPSRQCREAIMPFLCLFFFSLCDSSNHLHTILKEDCIELRDDICAEEWSQAVGFLGAGVLPACERLADVSDECLETNSSSPEVTILTNSSTMNDQPILCSEGFFLDENITNFCRPTCGEFRQTRIGVRVLQYISTCICFAASVVMFVLALTVQRESLLMFPLIFLVYLCVTTFILSGVIIVGLFDNAGLFCGSKDLIQAIMRENETAFCTISGFTFMYTLQQVCLWGGLHTGFVFWAMRYPFSYRAFSISTRIRYAHVISVILAVVIPLPGALIHLKGGYIITANPSLVCAGRNTDYTYYTFILPLSVLLAITTCLLVLIFWTLLKVFILKVFSQEKINKIGAAQLKIIAILVYYTALGVMGLITATSSFTSYAATDNEEITAYLACESRGMSNCTFDPSILSSDLAVVVTVLFSFLPVVAILFTCNPRICRKKRKVQSSKKTSVLSGFAAPQEKKVADVNTVAEDLDT